MTRVVVAVALAVVASAGCVIPSAKPPVTGVRATGEPLGVFKDSRVELTPTVVVVDPLLANAHEVRLVASSTPVWYPLQGDTRLVDEDFFAIAGDTEALAATKRMRDRGALWNRRGKYAMVGGAIVAVGGFFVPNRYVRSTAIVGGLVGISGGFVLAFWGDRQMSPELHAVDRSVAERAARRYNEQRGLGIAVARSF
jgi:hypothetical protein